jgi:hypothetical protein
LPPNIHIGSDDEKTLTKAIDSVFPNSKRSLCTKQMKENVNDYLRNKIGVKTVERLKVMEAIFGEEGILNAEDSYQFEQRSAAASTLMVPLSNEFLQYFNKTLKPKLLINFNNLGTEGLNSANRWTNNNAESIHNIMKVDTNWKPQSTSSLINILENMINIQFLDLHRALYNKGNYILHGIFRRHCIREDLFRTKTADDQKKYFHSFLKSTTNKPTFITSKDGQYKIPNKEKEEAKKPCQSKRPVNAKTFIFMF